MKKLMIFVDWFLPGYKAGGQLRSCANLSYSLNKDLQIYVVTTDRDQGDDAPYPSVKADVWTTMDTNLEVLYLSPLNRSFNTIRAVIRSIQPDCIYLNSMFSFRFTLLPVYISKLYNLKIKVVLAPRGMLHKGALQYKQAKKKVFFRAFRLLRFHENIVFHATDQTELEDIKKVFGKRVNVQLVDDFPAGRQDPFQSTEKQRGQLNSLFVSRISPKKNLLFILELLKEVNAQVSLSIVGPLEDEPYFSRCERIIKELPGNIKVQYLGAIPNQELPAIYRKNHLFVLPTHGENFGHVIFDSFLTGRPVLISDLTPWQNLQETKTGWEVPLTEKNQYISALEDAASWGQLRFDEYAKASWQYAASYLRNLNLKEKYLHLFA